jgi:hypothetical protein
MVASRSHTQRESAWPLRAPRLLTIATRALTQYIYIDMIEIEIEIDIEKEIEKYWTRMPG